MRILIALTLLTTFLALPAVLMPPVYADDKTSQSSQGTYGVEGLEEIDLEASAFPATKRGCAKRALFRVAMAEMYKKSKDPADLAEMNIIKPLVQGVYEEIGRDGITPFNLKTLNAYQECGQSAKPESSPEREAKAADLYKACSGINDLTLKALSAAKSKKNKDQTVNTLGKTELDVEGTSLENMEGPAIYLVEQIFSKNEESYDKAVDFAVHIGMGCLNRKD